MGCANLQAGEMYVPPSGAAAMVDAVDLTQCTLGVEGADGGRVTFSLSCFLFLVKLTGLAEELLLHVS